MMFFSLLNSPFVIATILASTILHAQATPLVQVSANTSAEIEILPRSNNDAFSYCTASYHGVYNTFNIYAKGWGDANEKGKRVSSHAANQFKDCGAITGWHSESNSDSKSKKDNSWGNNRGTDFEWSWHLKIQLPFSVNTNCVGRAIASAGGPESTCQTTVDLNL